MEFQYKILLVDDSRTSLTSMRLGLSKIENVKIYMESGAKEALETLSKVKIDLIITDINMPDINGYEFVDLVRKNIYTKNIPVIFITANFIGEEFEKKGFALGAIDYLEKPIAYHRLINRVKLYREIAIKEQELSSINKNLNMLVKEKTKELEHLNRSHQLAQDVAKIGHCEMDLDGNYTYWSDKFFELLGISKDINLMSYETIFNLIVEEDREILDDVQNAMLQTQEEYRIVFRTKMDDGSLKYFQKNCQPQYNQKNQLIYYLGTLQEVTQEKRLACDLLEKTQEVTNLSNEIIFISESLEQEVKNNYKAEIKKEKKLRPVNQNLYQQHKKMEELREKLKNQQEALKEQQNKLRRGRKNVKAG